jgi:hypothetical protein
MRYILSLKQKLLLFFSAVLALFAAGKAWAGWDDTPVSGTATATKPFFDALYDIENRLNIIRDMEDKGRVSGDVLNQAKENIARDLELLKKDLHSNPDGQVTIEPDVYLAVEMILKLHSSAGANPTDMERTDTWKSLKALWRQAFGPKNRAQASYQPEAAYSGSLNNPSLQLYGASQDYQFLKKEFSRCCAEFSAKGLAKPAVMEILADFYSRMIDYRIKARERIYRTCYLMME